ncbi:MAG: hypothetical protein FWD88_01345, partial [Treponema sp.]|nr:hypothetical protein [Treponema sp.]
MKRILFTTAALAFMPVFAATAHAQTVNLDQAIRGVAQEFAPNVERGTSLAVIAIQADSVGMANHLINGMIS